MALFSYMEKLISKFFEKNTPTSIFKISCLASKYVLQQNYLQKTFGSYDKSDYFCTRFKREAHTI
jgi:hypothetical protein